MLQPQFRFGYNTHFDDYTHLQIFTDRSLLEAFGFSVRFVCKTEPSDRRPPSTGDRSCMCSTRRRGIRTGATASAHR